VAILALLVPPGICVRHRQSLVAIHISLPRVPHRLFAKPSNLKRCTTPSGVPIRKC
jgi:hypothetical protein